MKKKEEEQKENRFAYSSNEGLKVLSEQDILDEISNKEGNIQKSEQNDLKGGKADNKSIKDIAESHNVDVSKIKEQLQMGVKVEMEHTDDPKLAIEIAMDHLVESPIYYTKLAEMESSFSKDKEKDERK